MAVCHRQLNVMSNDFEYFSRQVFTTPEYLEKRFGRKRLRITLSVISLALYVLTKIAVDLYAGALFIQLAFDINLYLAISKFSTLYRSKYETI